MRKLLTYINSLIASILTTALLLTVSFLIMLFSSVEEDYRTSYFGSIFFENYSTSEDIIEMKFGVANGIPIVITIVILFIVYFILLTLFKKKESTKS